MRNVSTDWALKLDGRVVSDFELKFICLWSMSNNCLSFAIVKLFNFEVG